MKRSKLFFGIAACLFLYGCAESSEEQARTIETGFITEQTLESDEGVIHYSYYLPDDYDESQKYPLVMTMPDYDMMWFGEDSSGANIDWIGFRLWSECDEDVIIVSATVKQCLRL